MVFHDRYPGVRDTHCYQFDYKEIYFIMHTPQPKSQRTEPCVQTDTSNPHLGFLLNHFGITSLLSSMLRITFTRVQWMVELEYSVITYALSHITHTAVSKLRQEYHHQHNYWKQLKTLFFLVYALPILHILIVVLQIHCQSTQTLHVAPSLFNPH